MLEIREDQIEALRGAVRRQLPEALLAALEADGLEAKRTAGDAGQTVVAARDARGYVTTLSFEPDGAPRRLTLPSGEHYDIATDGAGRLCAVEHSGGGRVELEHHASGLVKTLRRPGLDEHRFDYDAEGRLTALRYPDATREQFERDAEGGLVARISRGGARTEYERDRDGYLHVVRDPLGRETRYEYDAGKLKAVVFPDGSREEYGYDESVNAAVVTRRDGSDVYQELDAQGNLVEVIWPDGRYLDFDLHGEQLRGVYSDSSWVSFEHDVNGEVVREKTADGIVQASYDAEGRLTGLVTPFGDTIRYDYDPDGRLQTVVDWQGRKQRFKYGADGSVSEIRYGSGLVEKQRYSHHGRLAHARVLNEQRVLSEQRYEYDVCGRLAQIEDAHPRAGWQKRIVVDADGRVTSVVDGSGQLLERFEYDAKGNMVRDGDSDVRIGAMDEVLRRTSAAGVDELAYDALGNVTRLRELSCAYNGDGSMRETRVGDRVIRYEYDTLGRRVLKTDGIRTWRYGYFGQQLLWEELQEAPGAKGVRRDYLWAPDSVIPLGFREGGRTYWIQCDTRGAPIRVFKKDGSVAWSARYDAFGRAEVEVAHVRQPWRLAGQYHDDETGLHYQLCRYYCPQLKTYLARDPYWHKPDATNYSYARNCPYDYVDPFGGLAFLAVAAIAVGVGALVGAVVSAGITAAQGGSWRQIGAAAVSGAIEGAATVVGGIVGGMIGGPVGMVAGGMVGSALGTFAGTLAEQAINGDPICLKCAAIAAAQGALIDIALLGLGKIPGVKRLARKAGIYLLKKAEPIRRWAKKQIAKVNPKVPRRWADKKAAEAPKASPEKAAKESENYAKRQQQISDNFDNYDSLPDAAKPKGRDGKPLSKERVEQAYKGDPARGGERLPLTFKDWDEYDEFKRDLDGALRRGGVDDAVVQQVGSGTKGWAGNPKKHIEIDGQEMPKPWNPDSDTDFAIFSNKATGQAYAQNTPANTKIVQGDKYTVFKNGATRDRGFGQTDVGKELDELSKKWNKRIYGKEDVDGFDFKLNTTDQPFGSGPITTLKQ